MAGEVLWTPSADDVAAAAMTRFLSAHGLGSYDEGWRWSVEDGDRFWGAVWDWFGVAGERGDGSALADGRMPGASWFPGARLNYADQVFRWPSGSVAVVGASEDGIGETLTYGELHRRTAGAAAALRALGVGVGDRVAAYGPNRVEMLVAFLAAASVGAVWSSCSPDFGAAAVLDRFRQISPAVLVAADGYRYKGAWHDRREGGARLRQTPGRGNALGLVKFIFPNPNNVYMHDTPAKALFKRSRRDFSHGCIRVEDPVALARFVLGNEWNEQRIRDAMNARRNRRVDLPLPVQVLLYYTTAVVEADGEVYFFDDIYSHDAQLGQLLAREGP